MRNRSYATVFLNDVDRPPLDAVTLEGSPVSRASVIVGVRDLFSLADAAVWRKLIEGSYPGTPVLTLFLGATVTDLKAAFPPSQWPAVATASNKDEWERATRQAPTFVSTDTGILILGPVTDSIWDQFEALY